MEPRFVELDEIKIVGTEYIGKNQHGDIPKMWGDRFLPRLGEIRNCCSTDICYGLCRMLPDAKNGEFSYVSALGVTCFDFIPDGMVGVTIPGGRYAVFTHKGSLDKLKKTYYYIYNKWLPNSGLDSPLTHDFEYYDDRFHTTPDEESEVDIYVPIF